MNKEEIREKFLKIKENLENLTIVSNIDFKRKLASNVDTPENILEILANFNDLQLLSSIVRHSNLNDSIMMKILNAEEYSDEILEKIKEYQSEYINIKNKLLLMRENLDNIDYKNLKMNLASNPNTPKNILYNFLQDKDEKLRAKLSLNPNLEFEIYDTLKRDKEAFVRINLAMNIKTPQKILDFLSKDYIDEVKVEVSKNINCLEETFNYLSGGSNEIKSNLILNPNVPLNIKDKLSEEYEMKKIYIQLPSSPKKIVKELENDKDENVKIYLAKHPKITQYLIDKFKKESSEKIKMNLASNENIDIEVLRFLFHKRTSDLVKIGLAGNKNTPIEILEELAYSQNDKVLINLAKNKSITEEIFKKLWLREKLREHLIETKKIPENFLLKIINEESIKFILSKSETTSSKLLEEIYKDNNYIIDKNIINNKNVTKELLKEYLNKDNIKYDIELAKNEKLSTEDLNKLYLKTKISKYKINEEYDLDCILKKVQNEKTSFEDLKELIKYNSNTKVLESAYKSIENIDIEKIKNNFDLEEKEKIFFIEKKKNLLKFLSLYEYILPKVLSDLDCPYEIHKKEIEEDNFENIKIIIDNPNTHLKILMNLSRSNKQIKQYLLLKENLPISVLESIMEDHNMKLDIAKNPNTPTDLLKKLSNYHDIDVLKALAINQNSNLEILNTLSNNKKLIKLLIKNKNISIELLEDIKNNDDLSIEDKTYIEISLYNMYAKYI